MLQSHVLLKRWCAKLALLACACASSVAAQASPAQPCNAAAIQAAARLLKRPELALPASATAGAQAAARSLIAAACKPWPDDRRLTAVAVAYRLPDQPEDMPEIGLLVGLVRTSTGEWVRSHRRTLQEDAGFELNADGLALDTAPYRLAPDVRALGYVLTSSAPGPSCPDGGAEHELTLLIPDGAGLRPVFSVARHRWLQVAGEPACGAHAPRVTVMEDTQLTIAVSEHATMGLADLIVTAHVSTRDASDPPLPAADPRLSKPRIARKTVRYDGKRYPSDALFDFWRTPP